MPERKERWDSKMTRQVDADLNFGRLLEKIKGKMYYVIRRKAVPAEASKKESTLYTTTGLARKENATSARIQRHECVKQTAKSGVNFVPVRQAENAQVKVRWVNSIAECNFFPARSRAGHLPHNHRPDSSYPRLSTI